jgi:hypothetical protein
MTDTKDPILERLETDLARAQNTLEVYRQWEASGRTLVVQWRRDGGKWHDCEEIEWMSFNEYRIRPAPRTIWVNEYPSGLSDENFSSKAVASLAAGNDRIRAVKFQEVIE